MLENTQFVLVATVQKLFSMLRNGEKWDLGEPELNDRGQPIVHNVASKLGCLRLNNDLDLPSHSVFPEDEAGMVELARQLQDKIGSSVAADTLGAIQEAESGSGYLRTDRASSSAASAFDISPSSATASSEGFPPPSQQSPGVPPHPATTLQWISRPPSMDFAAQQMWMAGQGYIDADLPSQNVLASSFAVKPQRFSASCRNPEVMIGMGDSMIYAEYEEDPLRPLFPN